jgi:hypothetical protein
MSVFFYRRVFRSRSGDIEVVQQFPRAWFRPLYVLYGRLRWRAGGR